MKFKNNNRFSSVIFFVVMTAGIFSCETDLLNPVPKTTFSDVVIFDTPARIDLQVNGLYTAVKAGNFLGGRVQVYGDIRAEDFINRTANAVTGYPAWNFTLTETDANQVVNTWNAGYAAINQINLFIQGMSANAAKFVPPVFSATYSTTATNYVAEAKFLRAVCYYHLLQFYARPYTDNNGSQPGLPLRLKGENNSANNNLARSTVAEVYAQMLADLNDAEAGMVLDYPAGTTQPTLRVTRAHRNSAIAFKTRVYLAMGDYANVITEANKIVSATAPFKATTGVPHALSALITDTFVTNQYSVESILSFPFTTQNPPGTQNQIANYFGQSTVISGAVGEFYLNQGPTGIAVDPDFSATDVRRTAFVYASSGNSYTKKFPTGTPFTDNAPVIRYAEVLLNLAEARVQTVSGSDAQAIALLNAVHVRSAPATPFAGTITRDQILKEKRIEFLGEGLRNGDITRLKLPFITKGSVAQIPYASTLYLWPIPSSELVANTLMTRN